MHFRWGETVLGQIRLLRAEIRLFWAGLDRGETVMRPIKTVWARNKTVFDLNKTFGGPKKTVLQRPKAGAHCLGPNKIVMG